MGKNIGTLSARGTLDAQGFTVGADKMMKKAASLTSHVNSQFSKMGEGVVSGLSKLQSGNIFGSLDVLRGSLASSGIMSAANWLKDMAGGIRDWIQGGYDAIRMQAKMSKELGISREAAAAFMAVGATAGQSQDEMMTAARKALQNIGEMRMELSAGSRGGPAGSWLRLLGIDPTAFANMSSFSEQLGLVGDRLRTIDDASERAAAAQAIFGRSWESLMPQMRLGTDGMARMEAAARRLGVTVSGEASEAMTANARAMQEFRTVSQMASDGLRNQYVEAMLIAANRTRDLSAATEELIENQRRLQPGARQVGAAQGFLTTSINSLLGDQISGVATAFNAAMSMTSGDWSSFLPPPPEDWQPLNDAEAMAVNEALDLQQVNNLWRTRRIAIDDVVAGLQRQADAYGQTSEEARRAQFVRQNATAEELRDLDRLIALQRERAQAERDSENLMRLQNMSTTPMDTIRARIADIQRQGTDLTNRQRGAAFIESIGGIGRLQGMMESPLLGSMSANTAETAAIIQGAMNPQLDMAAAANALLASIADQAEQTNRINEDMGQAVDRIAAWLYSVER